MAYSKTKRAFMIGRMIRKIVVLIIFCALLSEVWILKIVSDNGQGNEITPKQIEEVMGNIDDEFDIENHYFSKIDNNTFIVDGLLSLVDLNNYLDINIKSDISDTVGGFLINEIGEIPKPNEDITIEYNNVIFKVEEVDEKRIKKVRISI